MIIVPVHREKSDFQGLESLCRCLKEEGERIPREAAKESPLVSRVTFASSRLGVFAFSSSDLLKNQESNAKAPWRKDARGRPRSFESQTF